MHYLNGENAGAESDARRVISQPALDHAIIKVAPQYNQSGRSPPPPLSPLG